MPKKEKFTVEQVGQALETAGGFVSMAAKKLRTSPKVLYDYLQRHEELRIRRDVIQERYLDLAESVLLKKIQNGDTISIIFYLKTKGKKRGYVERQEITGAEGENITINFVPVGKAKKGS